MNSETIEVPSDEVLEVSLNTKQCAEVALFMYREWYKSQQPPLFAVIGFEDWLKKLINDNPRGEEEE